MKILVMSDLHITATETLGTFRWDQDAFIAALDEVRQKYAVDRVVLNGDTFDLYKCTFKDIAARYARLIDYLRGIRAVFIRGNHDRALPFGQDFFGVVNSRREKIYIEHGHRADLLNGTTLGRLVGNWFHVCYKPLARWPLLRQFYYFLLEYDEGLRGRGRYNLYKYLRHAVRLHRKYDVVVLGHTHKLEVHNTFWHGQHKRYLNSGTCSLGRLQGIVLDTETLEHHTIRVEPLRVRATVPRPRRAARPAFNDGVLVPA
jgi:predicted phosphodiesterase